MIPIHRHASASTISSPCCQSTAEDARTGLDNYIKMLKEIFDIRIQLVGVRPIQSAVTLSISDTIEAMATKLQRAQPPATIPEKGNAVCKYNASTMLPTVTAMAKIGATNADMAAALDISLAQFYVWCNQFPDLREAVTVGKELFDTRVQRALAERALGYFARDNDWCHC
jgi:hypothetical protein